MLLLQVYGSSTFWLTIMDAFYQSLVCFFIPYMVRQSIVDSIHHELLRSNHSRYCLLICDKDCISFSEAYAGSDVGVLAFGSPVNASALLIILLHQIIESHTLVSPWSCLHSVDIRDVCMSNDHCL